VIAGQGELLAELYDEAEQQFPPPRAAPGMIDTTEWES
jgi:hypothetical protein